MDLSAIIFVVLALAWAVYLIPKALKHHDEMASDRLVEGHSDKVRILSRKAKSAVVEVAEAVTPAAPEPTTETASELSGAADVAPNPPRVPRKSARTAARRRRRVLGLLVVALAVVWTLTWFAYLPIWAPGVPGALVLLWLVIARLSVRKQQRRRKSRPAVVQVDAPSTSSAFESVESITPSNADEFLDQLTEDTAGLAREEIETALSDDGSLWDPLPMTLPTYVNKARARRTVRTIELTGINSSGHDETDSVLAREAVKTDQAAEDSEAQRRAAGA